MPSVAWVSDTRSASMPLGRFTARAGLALCSLLLAAGATGLAPQAQAQPTLGGSIALTSQNPWVENSSTPIRIGLRVRSSVPGSELSVGIGLYTEPDGSALASRDEFDATLAGQFAGLMQLSLATFSLSSLGTGNKIVDLYAGGSSLPGKVPRRAPSNQVFELPCPQRSGGCDGVYPLQISLVDTVTGLPLDSFTTYLIVAPPSVVTSRLRFSFVLPMGAPVAVTADGTSTVPRATVARIETIAGESAIWPGAPLTVDVYGQTLLALSRSREHSGLVGALAAGGLGSLVAGPFSAVDPTGLTRAGLGEELAHQTRRGRDVFARVLHASGSPGVYIATTPIGTRGLAALAALGVSRIVVPDSNLQSLSGGGPGATPWPYTLSAPFRITGSPIEGIQSDSGLASHLSGSGTPALRAQQLLADLAEVYFDAPNYPQPRGVVLVAPQAWVPTPSFLNAALGGLESSPIVATVAISKLFATVPPGTCQQPPVLVTGCSPTLRTIARPAPESGGSISIGEVTTARSWLVDLSSVIPRAKATIQNLEDAVLLAETAGLGPVVREAYLSAPLSLMRELGNGLSLPAGRTVTVTSSSARFPIAITSTSRTPIHVLLEMSGTALRSPTTTPLVLQHGTKGFIVGVNTRISGESSLQLQLLSPTGRFQLARSELTLRSTAISGVAIGLTAGAGAFLVIWWIRSASRRRRRRVGRHARSTRRETTSPAVPEPAS